MSLACLASFNLASSRFMTEGGVNVFEVNVGGSLEVLSTLATNACCATVVKEMGGWARVLGEGGDGVGVGAKLQRLKLLAMCWSTAAATLDLEV